MTTPSTPPDLSVIIVSWNTRDLLLRCLESLKAEAVRSRLYVDAIVVDNASKDGSAEAVREKYPDVTVLAQSENLGFAAGSNLGIREADGSAILILNPDTELLPGSLSTLWNTLNVAPHVGLVAPVLVNPDGTFQSAGYRFPGLIQTILDVFPIHPRLVESSLNGRFDRGDGMTPFMVDHPLGACMLVRREVIDQVGGFDKSFFMYSEEIDWCRRIKAAGWTVLVAPQAEVIHHGGKSTSQSPETMRPQLHRSRSAYHRRYQSEPFHRSLSMLLSAGIALKQTGLPIPTGGRTTDEVRQIAEIYRRSEAADD
jgi:N-acetylglucosaminyl-diphospho-decaprenol L-rhamnosyltransferase